MRRLNSIQSVHDMSMAVYYSESYGAFHVCGRHLPVDNPEYKLIFGTNSNVASSFVNWASKRNNLSNQPDKPFSYVGEKPPITKINEDWELFKSVYKSIIIK